MIQALLAKKIHCLHSFAYNGILIVLFNFCNVQTLNIYNIHAHTQICVDVSVYFISYFSLFCDLKFLKPYPWLQLHGVQSMCENVCYFYIDFLEKKLKTQIDFFYFPFLYSTLNMPMFMWLFVCWSTTNSSTSPHVNHLTQRQNGWNAKIFNPNVTYENRVENNWNYKKHIEKWWLKRCATAQFDHIFYGIFFVASKSNKHTSMCCSNIDALHCFFVILITVDL